MGLLFSRAKSPPDDEELAALRQQDQGLQTQQDAVLATLLARCWELGIELSDPGDASSTQAAAYSDSSGLERAIRRHLAVLGENGRLLTQIAELRGIVAARINQLERRRRPKRGLRSQQGMDRQHTPSSDPTHSVTGGQGDRSERRGDTRSGAFGSSMRTPASQPASSPSPSHPTRAVPLRCLACFDDFPEHQLACATADPDPGPSTSTGGNASACGHFFCTTCMSAYVRGAVRERRYPIRCPMGPRPAGGGADPALPQSSGASNSSSTGTGSSTSTAQGCGHALSREVVMGLLLDHPMEWQAFEQLEAERNLLAADTLLYCPHSGCSCPLVVESQLPANQPVSCPACHKGFCPTCRTTGWHEGLTCAQFQALPPHQRSAADVAVLQLSKQQRWKPCPSCKHMVEKSSGCNHMACRCGAHFCYRCGVAYSGRSRRCTC